MKGRSLERGKGISFECIDQRKIVASMKYHDNCEHVLHTWEEDYESDQNEEGDVNQDDEGDMHSGGDTEASIQQQWLMDQLPFIVCPLASSSDHNNHLQCQVIGVLGCDSFATTLLNMSIEKQKEHKLKTIEFVTAVSRLLGEVLDFHLKASHSIAIENLILGTGVEPCIQSLWNTSLEAIQKCLPHASNVQLWSAAKQG
jgi:hypothetical protein